ncbi:putative Extensin-3 precursor [Hibiscus syriacus]|uniref:Extensin-3 n=1 Tax=Hibiscus syriacus TaxID=106335 RepID=A0A6A2YJJ0_HIBSY|nr:putative Extensin-3 precursor [Hibiscus syriacus]
MAEESSEVQSNQEIFHAHEPNDEEINRPTSNAGDVSMKMESTRETSRPYSTLEHKPSRGEIWVWYVYELCSYFVHIALIPIVFSLIIGKIVDLPSEPPRGWNTNAKGLTCRIHEMQLYERLTRRSISVGNSKVSPLEWTSISWAIGLVLASPALRFISTNLDHGQNQQAISGAATAIGAFFCLPVGFFKVTWIFPLYIAMIAVAITIATASHTRHYGLMIRGFVGPNLQRQQFPIRRGVSSQLSLFATVFGSLGTALIVAFVYYMLRIDNIFIGLWVVCIFSGLMWLAGIVHIITLRPGATLTFPLPKDHFLSIFKSHHGVGSLIVVGLSSFTSMCIFTGGVLYLVGELCLKPVFLLYFWLIYFVSPSISLPLVQPVQLLLKADAVKMHLLGLVLSLVTSGVGFQFREDNWQRHHIFIFAALQSTSTGLMHTFARVLVMDCSPAGKEGTFAMWFSWVKMVGTCLGFAVASGAAAGNVGTSFGIAFCTAAVAMVVSIYGNISDVAGAVAAGTSGEEGESNGLDNRNSIKNDENENAKKEPALPVGEEAAEEGEKDQ